MKRSILITALLLVASVCAHADQAACYLIRAANMKGGFGAMQMKISGYNFARDTPRLYGLGTHNCSYVRDEVMDGQAAAVYGEQYKGSTGVTNATIWISKSTGRLVREEQDGDITGKGKGHISYRMKS
ncbi:MAG: hypothetical protein ACREPN_01965 [Rudaea sp.]